MGFYEFALQRIVFAHFMQFLFFLVILGSIDDRQYQSLLFFRDYLGYNE